MSCYVCFVYPYVFCCISCGGVRCLTYCGDQLSYEYWYTIKFIHLRFTDFVYFIKICTFNLSLSLFLSFVWVYFQMMKFIIFIFDWIKNRSQSARSQSGVMTHHPIVIKFVCTCIWTSLCCKVKRPPVTSLIDVLTRH